MSIRQNLDRVRITSTKLGARKGSIVEEQVIYASSYMHTYCVWHLFVYIRCDFESKESRH
jgi:hypothetical protein